MLLFDEIQHQFLQNRMNRDDLSIELAIILPPSVSVNKIVNFRLDKG